MLVRLVFPARRRLVQVAAALWCAAAMLVLGGGCRRDEAVRVEVRTSAASPDVSSDYSPADSRAASHDASPAASHDASFSSESSGTLRDERPALSMDAASVERRLADDVRYLASDELGGRGPFSLGLELAAEHIAREYERGGLDTRTFGGSPFQVFRSRVNGKLGVGSRLELHASAGARPFAGGVERMTLASDDFAPLSLSVPGKFAGSLAFVGYGITASEPAYDDYEGLVVAGRIVILLRQTPPWFAVDSNNRTSNPPLSPHAYLTRKAANAFAHGAVGVLLVTDAARTNKASSNKASSNETSSAETKADDDPLLGFAVDGKLESPAGPVVHCRRAVVDRLLSAAGQPSLDQLEREIGESRRPRSFTLDAYRASGQVVIEREVRSLKNVMGLIPGRGPLAKETVIVGAHYDHLGLGGASSLAPWTRAPHNGADDNASGTAALLEIARQASARQANADRANVSPAASSRQILFVAFSAEEMGLVGSERFVGNPPVPLRDVAAMVNLDMVGRLRNDRLIVGGTGTAREFSDMLRRLASPYHFRLKFDPSGYGPSDHATFYGRGIPVLHFFTGLHEDYHRPSDDAERIEVGGMRRIVGLVAEVVAELAQAERRPEPVRSAESDLLAELGVGSDAVARTSRGSRKGVSTASSGASSGASSTARHGLGIAVKLDDEGRLAIERVLAGSLAESAQLRAGDVIRQVGDTPVRSVEQLRGAVGEQLRAGRARLAVLRGSTELVVEVRAPNADPAADAKR